MIEVSALTKYYGQTRAIYDLSFTIETGQIVGFLGLNGAGKTTALKILAGYLLPTSGTVKIEGVDLIANPDTLRSRIGYLPEKPPLYDEMTVQAYLNYLGRLRGTDGATMKRRVNEVAELTGLQGWLDASIGTLSLGFRKRVGIAQAIIHDPALVILDEPISGLDPVQIVEMRHLIRDLAGKHTVLISSHILTEVEETCDLLLMLNDGELIASGSEQELLGRTKQPLDFELLIVGDIEGAGALLAEMPLVTQVTPGRAEADTRLFSITLSEDAPEQVAKALIDGGFGLRRLQPDHNPLEDVFLSMIGGES
jgi:ABC-2 type transport system ATP-binding protein